MKHLTPVVWCNRRWLGKENFKTAAIQILLATYNGERFLKEQLDSLLQQDQQDFEILIRDGGSEDSTPQIIAQYARCYPRKIKFIGQSHATAQENFSLLLAEATAELIMFCDQDDIWMPYKISRTWQGYRAATQQYGAATPIMVCSDSWVTDSQLRIIANSMFRACNLNPRLTALNRLLLQNVAQGNTIMANRALYRRALPLPAAAVMHDCYLALVATKFGQLVVLPDPLLYYRQHGANFYGINRLSFQFIWHNLWAGRGKLLERFYQNIDQAVAFQRQFGPELTAEENEMFDALARLRTMNFWQRRRTLWHYRVLKSGFLRNLGMFLVI